MVDWNVIRYITDKIGQGENPGAIKKQLVESGYDQKIINESFTQAIPWLKPDEQKKIQELQAKDAPKPVNAQAAKPAVPATVLPSVSSSSNSLASAVSPAPNAKQNSPSQIYAPKVNSITDTTQTQLETHKSLGSRKLWMYIALSELVIILILFYRISR